MTRAQTRSEFLDLLMERLAEAMPHLVGEIGARRMFGSTGLFADGRMFAILEDDTLYLKVDDETRPRFEAAGLEPFRYRRDGIEVALGYWTAPADMLEDDGTLKLWLGEALGASRRARRPKTESRRARQRPKS